MTAPISSPLLVITMEAVRGMLDRSLLDVMAAGIFLAVGLGATVLYRVRSRQRDRALLWFGLFSILYGVRILTRSEAFRDAFTLPERLWWYLTSFITYIILVPIMLLLWEVLPTWRKELRFLVWGTTTFGIIGIISDAAQRQPESLSTVNSALVLLALASFFIFLFRHPESSREIRGLRVGLVLCSLTIAANNIAGLFEHRLSINLEPLGFLALLISLLRLLTSRAQHNEERLLELDKELDIARRIQLSILPHQMPAGPEWDIDARYVPMTAVAGDFYDFFEVDEKRVGIIVADVSGHGVPAALIASMVKVAFAAELPHAASPSQVLSGINRTLCGKLQGQYVTAAYLYLDLAAHKMRYAAAAHPALFWLRANGETEHLLENGLMLGLFANAEYTEQECEIAPGDRFLLYTDGLLEAATPEGEFFGEARAKSILEQQRSQSANNLLSTLIARVTEWSPAAQDDLTLVAVGWRPRQIFNEDPAATRSGIVLSPLPGAP